jgi:hypothetical protein
MHYPCCSLSLELPSEKLSWTDFNSLDCLYALYNIYIFVYSRWFHALGVFYPEDRGNTFFRNVGSHNNYTAPHPRRRHSSIKFMFSSHRPSMTGINLITLNNFHLFLLKCKLNRKIYRENTKWPRSSLNCYVLIYSLNKKNYPINSIRIILSLFT